MTKSWAIIHMQYLNSKKDRQILRITGTKRMGKIGETNFLQSQWQKQI